MEALGLASAHASFFGRLLASLSRRIGAGHNMLQLVATTDWISCQILQAHMDNYGDDHEFGIC